MRKESCGETVGKLLACWVGATDLKASGDEKHVGVGPIAQACKERDFAEVLLLCDYPAMRIAEYVEWLKRQTASKISVFQVKLSSPTNFGEIYEAASRILNGYIQSAPSAPLTFHLSPGTPAMAAVWIILAKTRFPAELIESSRDHGVRTASVPFDISADFIPDLLNKPDRDLERLAAGLPSDSPEFEDLFHRSKVMQRVIFKARRVAPRSIPVLIEGESGTGKEVLAKAIHRASNRSDKTFYAINCGAIPRDLVESELFGHEKGSFTGAAQAKKGYFEEADGSTLFLDEIGELPLHAQVKMLRVLQEGEIVRVGAVQPKKINVRIIAATNRSLIQEVSEGRFREDLFYRLAVAVLRLPPLRDRAGDLGLLIDKLMERVNQESKSEPGHKNKKISASARNLILNHSWPGNIRELQNTLTRAAVWSSSHLIDEEDIREALLPIPSTGAENDILNKPLDSPVNLQEIMTTVAQHYLKRALDISNGNKTKTAEILGLPSYQTLTNWLKRYGLE